MGSQECSHEAMAVNRWVPKPATPLADMGHAALPQAQVRSAHSCPNLYICGVLIGHLTPTRQGSAVMQGPRCVSTPELLSESRSLPLPKLTTLYSTAYRFLPSMACRGLRTAPHAVRSTAEACPKTLIIVRHACRLSCSERVLHGACCPRLRRRRPMTRGGLMFHLT